MKICIDAGHGGADTGAVGGGLHEADVAWEVATRVASHLRGTGHDVVETRVKKSDGAPFSQDIGRRRLLAAGSELLVSIHLNSGDSVDANGCEAYVTADAPTKMSVSVATSILVSLKQHIQFKIRSRDGMAINAVWPEDHSQHSRLGILHITPHACLIEVGFVSSPKDRRVLATEPWWKQVALAVALGIMEGMDTGKVAE